MKAFVASLASTSEYVQSKYYSRSMVPAKEEELHEDYEARTWRERMHVNKDGKVFIPAMQFKNCIAEAAKYKSMKIPGKGNATFTKHFEAGVIVTDPLVLPDQKDEVRGEWMHVPSDGKRGGSKRVMKCFPHISQWEGDVTFYIVDEIITLKVFQEHLIAAGTFVGVGAFRPRNNGICGRFEVLKVVEQEMNLGKRKAG